MLFLPDQSTDQSDPLEKAASHAGFTFIEVMMGIAILGVISSSVIFGLTQLNHYATVNRLYTAAQTLAQNQIDLILTKGPFDPVAVPPTYPSPNILGEDATNLAGGATYTYYSDPLVSDTLYAAPRFVTIYRDPMNTNNTTNAIVQGTIQSRIKKAPHTVTTTVGGVSTTTSLSIRQATVTVAYNFRSRPYSVVMDTMRTPD